MAGDDNQALATAWDDFCDRLKEAGRLAFRGEIADSPLIRAAGVRYLARYIGKAVDRELNYADPRFPQFWHLQTPVNKSFGDNPDCTYLDAVIDGAFDYRIVGNRGAVHWVSFKAGGSVLHGRDLVTEWDGSFSIHLSRSPREGNWLKIDPGEQRVFVRQFFGDWENEQPMRIRIERVGANAPPPPPTPDEVICGLKRAGDWMTTDSARWPSWVDYYHQTPNTWISGVPPFTGYDGNAALLSRSLNFIGWRIKEDEALVIDVMPPACAYWNFELGDRWWNSVDYRYRLSSLNSIQAEPASDGRIWVVVSHRDPGIANWLDTAGNIEGMVNQRWVDATEAPLPNARLIAFEDLGTVLPPELARLSAGERNDQLRRRKNGVDRRFTV